MVMLIRVVDAESDNYPVQEPVITIFLPHPIVIFTGMEHQFIFTRNKRILCQ